MHDRNSAIACACLAPYTRHMRSLAAALCLVAASLPAQDWARAKLDASPRHHEYAMLTVNGKPLKAFVSYPEVKSKATAIVLIPEIFGLSDWAKEMADELSASGYVVIAPDVLTGMGPGGGGTESYTSRDAVTQAVSSLDPAVVVADLDAAADFVKALPASSGSLAVVGFCWGGGKSFAFATHRHDLSDAFVFYGPPPSAEQMKSITTPVYGFYAGNDARIGATLPQATVDMKAANKPFYPVTFDGAGHGFMRAGEDPADTNPANKTARADAYTQMTAILSRIKSMGPQAPPRRSKQGATSKTARPLSASTQCHEPKIAQGL